TAALLVFPVAYILNDCIAEVWGFQKAQFIIWCGFAMNFLAALFYQISVLLPPAPFWEHQDAYSTILSQKPRIAAASLLAFLAGSFLNAFVMSRMKVLSAGKHFSLRAIVSTLAGETIDSLLFFTVAFAGILPLKSMLLMVVTQTLLKSGYEALILPVTVRAVRYIKQVEQIDIYDKGISYNIFKINKL
ncbi:MAG: queuosine precursor transporter, partial [Bacteroidales bacterium]|nr:queuosine precursor transporter [Bacteroidales bacterium]